MALLNELLNDTAVAKRLGVDPKTLQNWRCRGNGPPFVRVGRLVRYEPESIQQWIESQRRTSTSECE